VKCRTASERIARPPSPEEGGRKLQVPRLVSLTGKAATYLALELFRSCSENLLPLSPTDLVGLFKNLLDVCVVCIDSFQITDDAATQLVQFL
jgi:hypothetical protein